VHQANLPHKLQGSRLGSKYSLRACHALPTQNIAGPARSAGGVPRQVDPTIAGSPSCTAHALIEKVSLGGSHGTSSRPRMRFHLRQNQLGLTSSRPKVGGPMRLAEHGDEIAREIEQVSFSPPPGLSSGDPRDQSDDRDGGPAAQTVRTF